MSTDTPLPVTRYLRSIPYDGESFAYLKLDALNRVMECGGNIEIFSIECIDRSLPIDEQLPSLLGLLPVCGTPVVIAYTQVGGDHYIDLHLYQGVDGQWVLLLDKTEAGKRLQREQQIRLDRDILNETKTA